ITLYDPPPGDGQEHPNQRYKAADKDPTTVWPTLEYRRNAKFGNLKHGVGLIFDLGRSTRVSRVRIQTTLPGTEVEVRVADSPGGPLESFTEVNRTALTNRDNTITLRPDVSGRYYLVWFTKLVQVGPDRFSGDLAEVAFFG